MLRSVRVWIGIAVSALFLYLIGASVDLAKTQEALQSADYRYLPLAVMLTLVTNLVRACRWRWVLIPIQRIAVARLFSVVAIGYMMNNLLPGRVGELVRAHVTGVKEGISRSTILATIVVERIFDGLALLFFLGLMAFMFSFPLWVRRLGMISVLFFVFALGIVYLVQMKNPLRTWIAGQTTRWLPVSIAQRVQGSAGAFLAGLAVLRRHREILLVFLFSLAVWSVEASTYYVTELAFGIHLPFSAALFTVAIVNLGSMIPAGPASLGTFEFFCMSALSLFSIENSVALSFAIVLHAIFFLPITAIGIFCFWRENLGFSDFRIGNLSQGGIK